MGACRENALQSLSSRLHRPTLSWTDLDILGVPDDRPVGQNDIRCAHIIIGPGAYGVRGRAMLESIVRVATDH